MAQSRGGVLENRDYAHRGTLVHSVRVTSGERVALPGCPAGPAGCARSIPVRLVHASEPDQGGPAVEIGESRASAGTISRHSRETTPLSEMLDTVSLEHQKHLFKAGIDVNLVDNRKVGLPARISGTVLLRRSLPRSGRCLRLAGAGVRHSGVRAGVARGVRAGVRRSRFVTDRFFDAAAFAQDQWRPKDTLTLRLGMRYAETVLAEPRWDPETSPSVLRVAMAWDPAGDGRTNVAAGVRIVFRQPVQRAAQRREDRRRETLLAWPRSRAGRPFRPGESAGRRLPARNPSRVSLSLTLAVSPSFEVPYTHQYSVTVNRQFAGDLVVSVSGVGDQREPLRERDRLQPVAPVTWRGTPARRREQRGRHLGLRASGTRPGGRAGIAGCWFRPRSGFRPALRRSCRTRCRRRRTASAISSTTRAGSGTGTQSGRSGWLAPGIRSFFESVGRRSRTSATGLWSRARRTSIRHSGGGHLHCRLRAPVQHHCRRRPERRRRRHGQPGPDRARAVPSDSSTSIGRNAGACRANADLTRESRNASRQARRVRRQPDARTC